MTTEYQEQMIAITRRHAFKSARELGEAITGLSMFVWLIAVGHWEAAAICTLLGWGANLVARWYINRA